jgi:hypothetical protein
VTKSFSDRKWSPVELVEQKECSDLQALVTSVNRELRGALRGISWRVGRSSEERYPWQMHFRTFDPRLLLTGVRDQSSAKFGSRKRRKHGDKNSHHRAENEKFLGYV